MVSPNNTSWFAKLKTFATQMGASKLLENPQSLVDSVVLPFLNTPKGNAICKSIGYSPEAVYKGVGDLVGYGASFIKNAEKYQPNHKVFEDSFTKNYIELSKYETLTEYERRALASVYAGRNHADILASSNWGEIKSVEEMSAFIAAADVKFQGAREIAGQSQLSGAIEETTPSSLDSLVAKAGVVSVATKEVNLGTSTQEDSEKQKTI